MLDNSVSEKLNMCSSQTDNETRFILISFAAPSPLPPPSPQSDVARSLVRLTCTTPRTGKSSALQYALITIVTSVVSLRKMDRRAMPLEVLEGDDAHDERRWPSVYLIELEARDWELLKEKSERVATMALEWQAIEATVLGVWTL